MIVNVVSYLNPFKFSGGGEQVLRALWRWGLDHAHKIHLTTVKDRQEDFHPKADVTVVADFFNDPYSLRPRPLSLLKKIIKSGRYVHFDNAYVDSCNQGYLPCSGQSQPQCPAKMQRPLTQKLREREFSSACFQQRSLTRELYQHSLMNVFVSPLHQRTIESMLGLKRPSFVLRPLIDTSRFQNHGTTRDLEYLFVGVLCEAKGADYLSQRFAVNPDSLTIIGKSELPGPINFGRYLGFVPYEQLPTYFNRAKKFVYHPRWPEPQGRVVVEAALCGCELDTNNMVGATSFDFNIGDPANLQQVEQEFWLKLESVIGK